MSELSTVTAKLINAYDRLIHANQVSNGAEFKAYCDHWGIDHAQAMAEAHARIDASLNRNRKG